MTSGPTVTNGRESTEAFRRWMALYRTRMYETVYSDEQTRKRALESQRLQQLEMDKPTILVIEDNADEWFMIRWLLLRQFPQAEAVWISDSTSVIPYMESCIRYEKDLPRLILLDLYLPDTMASLTLLRTFKTHRLYQHIPTVVVSRSSDPDDIGEAFAHACNSYIVKPTKFNEWLDGFSLLHTYWSQSAKVK